MSTKKAPLSFGDFLKNHRLGEEMTQIEFSDLLDISKQRLCDIEKDRFNVSIKLAKKIAKTLDLPPEWLVRLAVQGQLDREGIELKVS